MIQLIQEHGIFSGFRVFIRGSGLLRRSLASGADSGFHQGQTIRHKLPGREGQFQTAGQDPQSIRVFFQKVIFAAGALENEIC